MTASPTRRNSLAGIDPRDPARLLRISEIARSADGVQVRFETVNGKTYRIEYTDDLTAKNWKPLVNKIAGDGEPVIVLDPAAANLPQRFYRLVVEQP